MYAKNGCNLHRIQFAHNLQETLALDAQARDRLAVSGVSGEKLTGQTDTADFVSSSRMRS